jgi:hypothetical protein
VYVWGWSIELLAIFSSVGFIYFFIYFNLDDYHHDATITRPPQPQKVLMRPPPPQHLGVDGTQQRPNQQGLETQQTRLEPWYYFFSFLLF